MDKRKDGILKRASFRLNLPRIGLFGGGTKEAEYRDADGNIVPFEQTKWHQKLKAQKDEKSSRYNRG